MDPLQEAVRILSRDGLVVYPTETVYGLGGDAFSEDAIYRVYEAKRRPLAEPLSIAVSDYEMLCSVARVDACAQEFIETFLPGPVTVVLPAKSCLPKSLSGGTGMIGIRYPSHDVPIRLVAALDAPITATSANQHGGREPTTPQECHVAYDFLIDGGRLPGTPSTVVDLVHRVILRKGANESEVRAFLATVGGGDGETDTTP